MAAREPRANAAFLRLTRSGNHHDLGLFGLGAGAAPKRPGTVGLYHLAWQVDRIDELEAARTTLAELGASPASPATARRRASTARTRTGTSSR
ncbi:hypothetical protein [Pseudonocardia sp.]|uniref:hypothetical protein n=1 Tax=Pseudonocardia sp. TaxID=60912 RepID=UPI00261925B5|nr:hypothetical protein [Pseudonocardia sp.]